MDKIVDKREKMCISGKGWVKKAQIHILLKEIHAFSPKIFFQTTELVFYEGADVKKARLVLIAFTLVRVVSLEGIRSRILFEA